MSASPSADSRRAASIDFDNELDEHDQDMDSMSTTPLSGGSSHSGSGSSNQSTKDRRRERNRLAAQKHRLRRNERMAQLEAQVLALQQDKAMLVARLEPREDQPSLAAPAPTHASPLVLREQSVSSPRISEPEIRERKRQRTADPEPLVQSAPHAQAYHSRTSPPSPAHAEPHLPPISTSSSPAHDPSNTIRHLEERIRELESYTSSLASELSAHLSTTSGSLDRLQRLTSERAQTLSELGTAHAAVSRLRTHNEELAEENVRLREEMEGAEVALDLQRVENERLRERVDKEEREAREDREECRRLRRALRAAEDDAAVAAQAQAQAQAQIQAEAVAQASRMAFKREDAYQRQWNAIHHHDISSSQRRVQQLESAERDRRLVSVR